MSEVGLVSIIIDNYNYGPFLEEAIDSALNQTYPNTEVIVVDDGSTDNSREIIASYGDRIISILKENGGQASAFNAGFLASRGEVILFLDSDDMLVPTAVERAVALFRDMGVVKVHWPLWEVDKQGRKTGRVIPGSALMGGDLRELAIRCGPDSYVTPPTSGNAWSRRFVESVLPVPELEYDCGAETYLVALAPIFGLIGTIMEPHGYYRVHGSNDSCRGTVAERSAVMLRRHGYRCLMLSKYLQDMGIEVDREIWKKRNGHFVWIHGLYTVSREIAELIPEGHTFILADENQWGGQEIVQGRHHIPFPERNGQYWGPPPDDETAIQELERLQQSGANFMVFGWPAFWWLDHYAGLHHHLRSMFRCILENERLVVFDLRP